MGGRRQLAEVLDEQTDDTFRVVAEPRKVQVDEAGLVLLQVVRRTVKHSPEAPAGRFLNDVDVWVVVPYTDPEVGEDPLDDALDTVIEVLDRYAWILWTEAERTVYGETWPAYKITATLTTKTEEGS